MRTLLLTALVPFALVTGCAGTSGLGGGGDVSSAAGDTSSGASLYAANCASCHGGSAQGGSGPSLAGISDSAGVIDTILYGTEGMPGFADTLSDQEVSDILAYLGGLSGNGGGGGEEGEDDGV